MYRPYPAPNKHGSPKGPPQKQMSFQTGAVLLSCLFAGGKFSFNSSQDLNLCVLRQTVREICAGLEGHCLAREFMTQTPKRI